MSASQKSIEALSAINLQNYADVLASGSGCEVGLAVLLDDEVLIDAGAWRQLFEVNAEGLASDAIRRVPLLDYQLNSIAEVLLLAAEVDSPADTGVTPALFEAVVSCVQEELAGLTELFQMTDELTSRYEELNLVFSDQDKEDAAGGIEHQLRNIVESCSQYMQLSLCFMVLGNRGLSFLTAKSPELQSLGDSISLLSKPVSAWLRSNPGSHVFNKGLEFELQVPENFRNWRHIITPVTIGASDNVAGFMVVAKSPNEAFFTNSDKNLLEVMARKASKLIRSTYDDLTLVLRRSAFQKQLDQELLPGGETPQKLALLLLNIDRMQVVNEAHSHEAGNELLIWLAKRLEDNKGADDIIGRFGGDQFLVLLKRRTDLRIEHTARKILEVINSSEFRWRGKEIEVSISAGLAVIDTATAHAGQALAEAEFACAAAKEHGGGTLEIFASGDALVLERHAQINQVSIIQAALKENEFVLFVQPIKPLVDPDRAPHAEVLIRLRDKDGQIVPPGLFLPAAERFNLMPSIDRWVVGHAFSSLKKFEDVVTAAGLVTTINLSGQALSDSSFIDFLRDILDQYNPAPGSICFEVTETTAIRDMQKAREFMEELRDKGVSFALDDFGTGLSSFSYLQQLPLDALKIDGSFVREIVNNDVARTMVKAINDVGQSMGLVTIAEFVSDAEIEAELRAMGVDYGQGFSLARPMPLEDYLVSLGALPTAKRA